MAITRDQAAHIAHLARLSLSDDELDTITGELSLILDMVDQLQAVDTTGVTETAQVTGLQNVTRPDIITPCENPDALLQCSPHPITQHSVTVPRVM